MTNKIQTIFILILLFASNISIGQNVYLNTIVKNIIAGDNKIKAIDKEQAMKLIELDVMEMENVSTRWTSDMKSDSWLSKNTRPLTLIYLTLASTILIILDSFHSVLFSVDTGWIELLKTLLITVYVAYFGSRGAEKITKIKQ